MKRILGSAAVIAVITFAATAQLYSPVYGATGDIPAHHESAPTTRQPALLNGSQLSGPNFAHPYQVTAYKLAAQVGSVLYQEPCYCRCDKSMGHTSLHSCFEGLHGAECSTCMKEGVYTYRETRSGKTPAQIRAGIMRGEYQNVDLESLR